MGKIQKILEIIWQASYTTAEIFELFFTDYYTSYRRARGLPERKYKSKKEWREAKLEELKTEERERFYTLISKLKREGLVEKLENSYWVLTDKGESKLVSYKTKKEPDLPKIDYLSSKSNTSIIIVFDIPEKERKKRVWLRFALKRLGFKMLQKSVWLGEVKLPEKFIKDLRRLRLLSYVEILEVTKTGSLNL